MRGHLAPETGCGLNIGVWSMTVKPREREEGGGEGRGGHRTKTGSLQSWPKVGPNLAPQDGQGFRIRPLFSVGAKGAESSDKRRQIRRPFHSDVRILRFQARIFQRH